MPKAKPVEKPIDDPYWRFFEQWVIATHGGMHDQWLLQWKAFKAGAAIAEAACCAVLKAHKADNPLETVRTSWWPL